MAGINKVILIGNLGQDIELKYTTNGDAVANISIATSESWTDKNSGQKVEKTEWHRIVMFKKTAEIAAQYLHKGSKVYIEGKLQTRKWQDQQGQDRYSTDVVCKEMQFLDKRDPNLPPPQSSSYVPKRIAAAAAAAPTAASAAPAPAAAPGNKATTNTASGNKATQPAADDFDDDIPF